MPKFTIIYTPTIDYEFMQQRPQRLMEQFARAGHQVYYINLNQRIQAPREVEPNLTVIYNHADVERVPKNYPVVLWMSWAKTHDWIERIRPALAVYDCLDDFADWRTFENQILPKVDLVTTTADLLYQKMKDRHPRVVMVKNGCEYEHFAHVEAALSPADWPQMTTKVVGYVGALGHWMDAPLVGKLANHYEVVLIGPEFGMPHLHHPRIHRMGLRNYQTLPSYLKCMDSLIIPFQLNDITRATNPIKMYEYLATGKPVITTEIPEALLYPEVYASSDHDRFINLVHLANSGAFSHPASIAARKRIGQENSWATRCETALTALCAAYDAKYKS